MIAQASKSCFVHYKKGLYIKRKLYINKEKLFSGYLIYTAIYILQIYFQRFWVVTVTLCRPYVQSFQNQRLCCVCLGRDTKSLNCH